MFLDPILSPDPIQYLRGTFHRVVNLKEVLYLVILTKAMFIQEETLGLYLMGSVVRRTTFQARGRLGTHTPNSLTKGMDCHSSQILSLINRVMVFIHKMLEYILRTPE